MFFTKIGKIIAYVGFGFGIFRITLSLVVALGTDNMETNIAFAKRYLAASNSGEAMNEGFTYILVSVALGILCEISVNCKADTCTQPPIKHSDA